MPWQGRLIIGEVVSNWDEVAGIYKKLGGKTAGPNDDPESYYNDPESCYNIPSRTVTYKGTVIEVVPVFFREYEGGCPFPSKPGDPYTDAFVGFELTSRYSGSILDKDCPHGAHEPFVFDLLEVQNILEQVRQWWTDAQTMIHTAFH